jgi:hypothetical protein
LFDDSVSRALTGSTISSDTRPSPIAKRTEISFSNRLANQWQGNQYYLVVENPVEPNDMVNLGFRVDTLLGNDWECSTM